MNESQLDRLIRESQKYDRDELIVMLLFQGDNDDRCKLRQIFPYVYDQIIALWTRMMKRNDHIAL
jgi:hypothetical protein